MNAEILCVGTELLLGDVVNTNAAYLSRALALMGINVYHHTVVGDNPTRLKECLKTAIERSDLVLMTGGLGPTYDDLTKETVAEYFGKKMVLDEEILHDIEQSFAVSGRTMTPNNRKQAVMPEGCVVLPNPNGTAPGCVVEGDGKTVVLMPGPPREMQPMFDGPVRDYLAGRSNDMLISETLNLFGAGESFVESKLRDLMVHSLNPTVAPYAKTGELQLRVTARAKTHEEGMALIRPVVQQIEAEFGAQIYGHGYQNLEDAVVKEYAQKHLKLAVAESCTGGLVTKRLTDIAGASASLLCGVCAYQNEMKEQLLGVRHETLECCGAVSRECALEMARGVRRVAKADIGVSTTGIAGPGGGTDEKPVGLVFVAVSRDGFEEVRELHLGWHRGDDRETIRNQSSSNALYLALLASRV